jgi:hypothetical protein
LIIGAGAGPWPYINRNSGTVRANSCEKSANFTRSYKKNPLKPLFFRSKGIRNTIQALISQKSLATGMTVYLI